MGTRIETVKLEADYRDGQFKDLNEIGVNSVPVKRKGHIDLLGFSEPFISVYPDCLQKFTDIEVNTGVFAGRWP